MAVRFYLEEKVEGSNPSGYQSESLSLLSSESVSIPDLRESGLVLAASEDQFMASNAAKRLAISWRSENRGVGWEH